MGAYYNIKPNWINIMKKNNTSIETNNNRSDKIIVESEHVLVYDSLDIWNGYSLFILLSSLNKV